jgi:excisionase family DNA binding protein
MQVKSTRFYRVKAVADMLDVSVNTIYRAVESGKLRAAKFGEGTGALRISEHAIAEYVAACESGIDTDAMGEVA